MLLALVALTVDYLAVTRRSPSLAGLPLMATFLGAAANSGDSLNPLFFLAVAAVWLVMVARQGAFLLRRWSTTIATPVTPGATPPTATASPPTRPSPGRSAPLALVLAVALPVALPHLPTRFLLAGLGRNDGAAGRRTARWASPRASTWPRTSATAPPCPS